jgi:hypothetical protein
MLQVLLLVPLPPLNSGEVGGYDDVIAQDLVARGLATAVGWTPQASVDASAQATVQSDSAAVEAAIAADKIQGQP